MSYSKGQISFILENHKTMSHAEIAAETGKTSTAIRNFLWRRGLSNKELRWSEKEVEKLKTAYNVEFSSEINLDALSKQLRRSKSNICRKARSLGFTDRNRRVIPEDQKKIRKPKYKNPMDRSLAASFSSKEAIRKNGHPRGMLGKKHSEDAKDKIAKASKEAQAKCTDEDRSKRVKKMMKTREKNGTYSPARTKASWKNGWREIGDRRVYFRSAWEANFARYLESLKNIGEIKSWEHEPRVFWFEGIKRGCTSYLPDFSVIDPNGHEIIYEIKGWMDSKSKTKIKRMRKYFPDVDFRVVDSTDYKRLSDKVSRKIEGWEK